MPPRRPQISGACPGEVLLVGPDRLRVAAASLEIDAARPLDGWEVSSHRPTLVHHDGQLYVLTGAEPRPRGRVTYRLERHPTDVAGQRPGRELHYDAEVVRQRDQARRVSQAEPLIRALLWLASPVLGFLPAATKVELHRNLGVHAHALTRASLLLEYGLVLLYLLLLAVEVFALALGRKAPVSFSVMGALALLALVAGIDAFVRYGRLLSRGERQYGLLEWVWRRLRDGE